MNENLTDSFDRGFGSDNHAPVHPNILQALQNVTMDHAPSYGTDDLSELAIKKFKQHFGEDTEVFFVFNGTAANILALKVLCKSYNSVFCTDIAHIHVDEAGGPEVHGGYKLIPLPHENGKLTVEILQKNLIRKGDQHFAQAKVVSLTQPTEIGTVYSIEEIQSISQWAHDNGLYLHIDGARLSNACVQLNSDFKKMIRETKIDAVSFGGTKNGLLFGEAILVFNKTLANDLKFYRKQLGQLPSKSRYLAAQFVAYFENDLWKKIASHSLQMAQYLYQSIKPFSQIQIREPVQSNAVFVQIPKDWVKPLRNEKFFYVWDEHTTECRWMTSWDTQKKDIDQFVLTIKELIK